MQKIDKKSQLEKQKTELLSNLTKKIERIYKMHNDAIKA